MRFFAEPEHNIQKMWNMQIASNIYPIIFIQLQEFSLRKTLLHIHYSSQTKFQHEWLMLKHQQKFQTTW